MTKKLFKFYTDKKTEYSDLYGMVIGDSDITNSVNRAIQYGIPKSVVMDKTGNTLKDFLYKQYVCLRRELKQSLRFHKSYISKHGDKIRQKLESAIGHKIPTYSVRLNIQIEGMSDWYGTDININAFSYLSRFKKNDMLLALVWETALSQTFIDIRKKYTNHQINDKKVWAISELTAITIWKTYFSEYDWESVNVGYPELIPHQNNITKLFNSRRNFDEYLSNAVKLFKTIKLK